jgi:hypothetical protein
MNQFEYNRPPQNGRIAYRRKPRPVWIVEGILSVISLGLIITTLWWIAVMLSY